VRCGRKWTGSRGRWSSPKGINGGGGLAKPDEVELFPLPRTEEEDVGRRLSPVGSSRWTIGSREGELKRGVDGLLSMQGGKGGGGGPSGGEACTAATPRDVSRSYGGDPASAEAGGARSAWDRGEAGPGRWAPAIVQGGGVK
jgi:hypothetical protein